MGISAYTQQLIERKHDISDIQVNSIHQDEWKGL